MRVLRYTYFAFAHTAPAARFSVAALTAFGILADGPNAYPRSVFNRALHC